MKILNIDETKLISGGVYMEAINGNFMVMINKNEGGFLFADYTLDKNPHVMLNSSHTSLVLGADFTSSSIVTGDEAQICALNIVRENLSDMTILHLYRN